MSACPTSSHTCYSFAFSFVVEIYYDCAWAYLTSVKQILPLTSLILTLITQEYGVFMYFRSHWRDDRLENLTTKNLVLNKEYVSHLWHPDIFCSNARKSDLMIPDTEVHSMVILRADGSVTYSRK